MSAYRDLIRAADSLIHTTEDHKVCVDELDRLAKAVEAAKRDRAKARSAEARQDFDAEMHLRDRIDHLKVLHAMAHGDLDDLRRENRRLYQIIDDAMRELRDVRLPLWNADCIRRAKHRLLDAVPMTEEQGAVAMRGRMGGE